MPEIPPVEVVNREIAVYDPETQSWKRGRRTDFFIPQDVITLTWTNTGVATNVTPDTDLIIDTLYATRIAIQIDTTNPNNTSGDIDINVHATLDGVAWDTIPYAERNIGDKQIKTFLVEVCPKAIRLRLDNNAAGSTVYASAKVLVVK